MDVSFIIWAITIAAVLALFALDLGAAVRNPQEVRFQKALWASLFYLVVAIAFGVAVGIGFGWQWGGEYFAGYLLERSLSIDNLFVFVVLFSVFAVPRAHQQRVLVVGIFLALILRVIFIVAGAAILEAFSIGFLIFGILLLWTAVQLFRHRNEDPEINDNIVIRTMRKRLPFTTEYHEGKFTVRLQGRRFLTPMVLVLAAVATTDLLFALDSIPAIFGVTQEVYIVFAANAFALLGMRPLFFLVTGLLDKLVYLSTGLSLVLGLIGVKLGLHWAHLQWSQIPEIPTLLSLLLIALILGATTIASILRVRRDPEARAHAGTLRSHKEDLREK